LRFGVSAAYIRRRIGFGIALLLRLGQCLGVGPPALLHLRKDIVARAVDDSKDRLRLFGGEALAEGADHRDAAADASLEAKLSAVPFRRRPDFRAETGEHSLVRSHHRFAVTKRPQEVIPELRQLRCALESQRLDD